MVNVSTVRKLSIAARIAAQHAGRTRTVGAVLKGARATATHFGRVLHQLWLEVTGFVFLALAFSRTRSCRNYFHTDLYLVRSYVFLESLEKKLKA
jgi:hypothetical protein